MNRMQRGKEISNHELHRMLSVFLAWILLFGIISINIIRVSAEESNSSTSATIWNGTDIDISWYTGYSDEYAISTPAQLAGLASLVNGGNSFSDVTITLTSDIDLGGEEWTTIGIGETVRFSGTFDGDGHTISNLTISTKSNYQGLFSSVSGAVIKNLGIVNPNISGISMIGAIVGYAPGTDILIDNCFTSGGSVSGSGKVGGLVGYFGGKLTNCSNEGTTVSATETSIGGLVGFAAGGIISNCYNTGTVSTDDYNYDINIATYEAMHASIDNEEIKNQMITQSIADDLANICGVYIGGIVGEVDYCTVSDCYSAGNIILGTMTVTVSDNTIYADPLVDYSSFNVDTDSATYKIGGIAGSNTLHSTVSNCYYDSSMISSSTLIDSTLDGQGLTTNDMTGSNALTVMNFDSNIWKATEGYPILISSLMNSDTSDDKLDDYDGSGTGNDSYQADVLTIINAEIPTIISLLEDATYEYETTVTVLDATATVNDGGTVSYQWYRSINNAEWSKIEGENFATYTPSNTLIGTTYYKVEVTNTIVDNGDGGTKSVTITSKSVVVMIGKMTAIIIAPTAIDNLTCTQTAQNLISAGSTSGGIMYYSIDGINYSADIPTGTDAGVYIVYYKVVGNDNYNDVDAKAISVTIGEATVTETIDSEKKENTIDQTQNNSSLQLSMVFTAILVMGTFVVVIKRVRR